ncbi:MAG: 2OG-Fe(II) oxygenase [Gammaproteobacteria bacterium]
MKVGDIGSVMRAAQKGDADAQFRLANHYLSRRQNQLADQWMNKAAALGHERAQLFCAVSILAAPGNGKRLTEACEFLVTIVDTGHPEANFLLANQLYLGDGIEIDLDRARHCLETAVRAELPAAWRVLAMLHAGHSSNADTAMSCFYKAASLGDPFAQYAAAARLFKLDIRTRKEDIVVRWLENASMRGVYLARILLEEIRTQEGETGSFRIQDLVEETTIEQAMAFEWPEPRKLSLTVIAESPLVAEASNALRKEECDYIVSFAHPALSASRAIDPSTGKSVRNPVRTSSGMNFSLTFKDIVVGFVERTMAAAAGLPMVNGEPLAVLHYQPGEEYKPHFDAFLPNDPGAQKMLAMGGQRAKTVLVYLNDNFEGGATDFPNRAVKVEPEAGKLLLMENCNADGTPSQFGLHAGLPVTEGEKWLASMWMREQAFRNLMIDE